MERPERKTGVGERSLPEESGESLFRLFGERSLDPPRSGEVGGVEHVRSVFESVLLEMLDGSSAGPAPPRFPGFTVLEKVGQGGFGIVYRARDEKLGREVALKVLLSRGELDAAARERFLKEARALASLRHPNVLTIHGVLEHEGQTALVSEFIEGQPLSDLLRERGPLGAAEAAQVGVELCRALAAAHRAGLVHRDVKTPNILRERGGRVVLTDFGLGVFLAEGRDAEKCGFLAGSPLFMSPEQVRGGPVDPRTDLYALGVVLYNLATGKFPLSARNLKELFSKIRAGEFLPLRDQRPDLPESFIEVVGKALSMRPEDRFQSAGAMEEALLGFLGESRRITRKSELRVRSRWLPALVVALPACCALAWLLHIGVPGRGGFQVEAKFFEMTPVGGQPLIGGEQVPLGTTIYLEYRSDQATHLYVLNESSAGERFVLFPLPGGALKNPLPAGVHHRLPGVVGTEEVFWRLSTPSDEEWLLLVASREPLEALEDLVENTPRPHGSTPAYARLKNEEVRGVLRGFGELEAAADEALRGAGLLARVIADLEEGGGREESRKVWIRKLALRGESR